MSKKNIIISKKKYIDVIKINKENSYNEKKNNIIYNIKDLNDKKNIFSDKEFEILNDNIDEKTSQNSIFSFSRTNRPKQNCPSGH